MSGYLLIIRYSPRRYLLGGYPVHQGKLNRLRPILARLGYISLVLIVDGVIFEGPEEVDYLNIFTYLIYLLVVMELSMLGRDPEIIYSYVYLYCIYPLLDPVVSYLHTHPSHRALIYL